MSRYLKIKRFLGCRKKRPCILCPYENGCMEAWWDEQVIVMPDGTHTFSRAEIREMRGGDLL